MKTITLWQPWASLVAIGAKKIETRSWATNYRGPIAIHAAKKDPHAIIRKLPTEIQQAVFESICKHYGIQAGALLKMKTGAVIATCNLADCVLITPEFTDTLSEQEITFGDYTPGRWAWILEDVKPLDKSVPAVGKQRLWEWETPEGGMLL